MSRYLFERDELARLRGIEALGDPITTSVLDRIGIEPGWRVAEIGAGAGSIAAHLANLVGPTGQVLATEVNLEYLEPGPNLEILRHDVTAEDPPTGPTWDLVHARNVLSHLRYPTEVVMRLMRWLRPGGWLVIEDGDWFSWRAVTSDTVVTPVLAHALKLMRAGGYDPDFARDLPATMHGWGLVNLDAQILAPMIRGATSQAAIFRLTLERLSAPMISAGMVTAEHVSAALRECDNPHYAAMPPALVSVWGQVPD